MKSVPQAAQWAKLNYTALVSDLKAMGFSADLETLEAGSLATLRKQCSPPFMLSFLIYRENQAATSYSNYISKIVACHAIWNLNTVCSNVISHVQLCII